MTKPNKYKNYNISKEDYMALFLKQKGCCAICGDSNMDKPLCIDHDHKTDKVRGLLCNHCNFGLGFFRDNPKSLWAAIMYLDKPPFK